jgi:hypothetical protein
MADELSAERRQDIEEHIKDAPLKGSYREHFIQFIGKLESDDEALIVLKGHLVLEERLTAVIEKFVFHPEHLEKARLSFAQKVNIARCLSLDESANAMWDLIEKINALRNKLSHSLDGEPRARAMDALKASYRRELGADLGKEEEQDARIWLAGALSMCLGFVHSFELEVERFKDYVAMMDRFVNPHRHKKE